MLLTDKAGLSDAEVRAMGEARAAIARQLRGPLTALLLYMEEIESHSHEFAQADGDRFHLQQVARNALEQVRFLCAMLKQIEDHHKGSTTEPTRIIRPRVRVSRGKYIRTAGIVFSSDQEHLTKRELEVLNLISEGHTNKQGALRLRVSPRTFESHRSALMRKLGANNAADLVRISLLHPELLCRP